MNFHTIRARYPSILAPGFTVGCGPGWAKLADIVLHSWVCLGMKIHVLAVTKEDGRMVLRTTREDDRIVRAFIFLAGELSLGVCEECGWHDRHPFEVRGCRACCSVLADTASGS